MSRLRQVVTILRVAVHHPDHLAPEVICDDIQRMLTEEQLQVTVEIDKTAPKDNRQIALQYCQQLFDERDDHQPKIRLAIAHNPIRGLAGLGPDKADQGDPDAYLIGMYDVKNDWWAEGVIVTNGQISRLPCVIMIDDKPATKDLPWEEVFPK